MTDVITYCKDTELLAMELEEKYPSRLNMDNKSSPKFLIQKSQTVRNGNETLSLVRVDAKTLSILESLDSIQILGSYQDIFMDPAKLEIYNRIYPPVIINIPDPEDPEREIEYRQDRRFAEFA